MLRLWRHFWFSWLQHVLRAQSNVHLFDISTWKTCPSQGVLKILPLNLHRAKGACNFYSMSPHRLVSLLSTLRSHKALKKNCVSRLFYLFVHLIFPLLILSSLTSSLLTVSPLRLLRALLLHLCILSKVWLSNLLQHSYVWFMAPEASKSVV